MQTFSTTLSGQPGTPTGIEVPAHVVSALGPKKNPAVLVALSRPGAPGEYHYRSTVAVMGGLFMIPLSAAHRAAAGVQAGDPIAVSLELDTAPRTVEVPADLAAALDEQEGATEAFTALAPSKRKEAVRQLEDAKTPETRERRMKKLLSQLG
ncbi:YdeI/OmpD-associated family protein [Deinococcus radiomollis]|uniref:YdeI/OmpD-associated family protein n=1 Tax=Deinococcus radiomollis TaxID=468916 RepID=UPI003892822E